MYCVSFPATPIQMRRLQTDPVESPTAQLMRSEPFYANYLVPYCLNLAYTKVLKGSRSCLSFSFALFPTWLFRSFPVALCQQSLRPKQMSSDSCSACSDFENFVLLV